MKTTSGEGEVVDRLLGKLVRRRAARPPGGTGHQRFVTGEARREHRRLVAARRILSWLSVIGLAYSCASLPLGWSRYSLLSGVTVLESIILFILPLLEIVLGAGTHFEVEYRTRGRQLVKCRFEPSLPRFTDLLPPLAISLLGVLAGFASLHSYLSTSVGGSYSEVLTPVGAVYYSLAAFSGGTVGISPLADGARALTGLQALLGWLAGVVIVATILGWVVRNRRPRKATPSSRYEAAFDGR